MCCFCSRDLDEIGLDPCALLVTSRWLKSEEREQFSQQFFCHAACLKSKMNQSAAGSAYFADEGWQPDQS
jgi:hypothetical protein